MFSNKSLITPKAKRLNAKGSFELVGFWSIPKKPTKVSSLSVKDKAILKSFFGVLLLIPVGKYCSRIARDISLSKP